jgi:hypothetical protein
MQRGAGAFRVMRRRRNSREDWIPFQHSFETYAAAVRMARELSENTANIYAVFDEKGRLVFGPDGSGQE